MTRGHATQDRPERAQSACTQVGEIGSAGPNPAADLPRSRQDRDDLGLIGHPAPNVGPGDMVMLPDGREALVTARVQTGVSGHSWDCWRFAIAPTPLTSDDSIA